MNPSNKLLAIHATCHVMLIPAFMYGDLWMFFVSVAWWWFVAATAISSGYHRYFSHRSFKTGVWYEWYVQIIALFANPGPVITWAASHRMHHRYCDTHKDPHSPKIKGFWRVYSSRWGDITIERKFLKGLSNTSTRFFYNHYFKLITALMLLLFVVDIQLFIFMFAVPVVLAFHGYGLINAYTHRNAEVENSVLANMLTAGEGYHRYHHEEPWNWRIGKKWYHMDTAAWFIKLIKQR